MQEVPTWLPATLRKGRRESKCVDLWMRPQKGQGAELHQATPAEPVILYITAWNVLGGNPPVCRLRARSYILSIRERTNKRAFWVGTSPDVQSRSECLNSHRIEVGKEEMQERRKPPGQRRTGRVKLLTVVDTMRHRCTKTGTTHKSLIYNQSLLLSFFLIFPFIPSFPSVRGKQAPDEEAAGRLTELQCVCLSTLAVQNILQPVQQAQTGR